PTTWTARTTLRRASGGPKWPGPWSTTSGTTPRRPAWGFWRTATAHASSSSRSAGPKTRGTGCRTRSSRWTPGQRTLPGRRSTTGSSPRTSRWPATSGARSSAWRAGFRRTGLSLRATRWAGPRPCCARWTSSTSGQTSAPGHTYTRTGCRASATTSGRPASRRCASRRTASSTRTTWSRTSLSSGSATRTFPRRCGYTKTRLCFAARKSARRRSARPASASPTTASRTTRSTRTRTGRLCRRRATAQRRP
ncbi:hypothetical protein IWQ57_006179, partial [Coemansia nantahalensis]